jgi:hypothetical protein
MVNDKERPLESLLSHIRIYVARSDTSMQGLLKFTAQILWRVQGAGRQGGQHPGPGRVGRKPATGAVRSPAMAGPPQSRNLVPGGGSGSLLASPEKSLLQAD